MTDYSVSEAKNNFPKLLDLMLAGEEVVITRRGKAIGRLEATEAQSTPARSPGVEWFRKVRVKPMESSNAVDLVRQMRDED